MIYYTCRSFIPAAALRNEELQGLQQFIGAIDSVKYAVLLLEKPVTIQSEVTLTLCADWDYRRVKVPAGSKLTLIRRGDPATAAAIQVE